MLLSFQADVISLKPKAVVIECGANDIAGNTGFSTFGMIEINIKSMAEIAGANKIKVILGSTLPANAFWWSLDVYPADSIVNLNIWIKEYAQKNHLAYLDYYSTLVNDQKGMKRKYSEDGGPPNKAGYIVMEKLALASIRKSLK